MTRNAISWHPADVRAAIAKKGGTLSSIARHYGLHHTTPGMALRVPCYAGEQAVAAFLDLPAKTIWPARYDANGLPLHPRIRKAINATTENNASQNAVAA